MKFVNTGRGRGGGRSGSKKTAPQATGATPTTASRTDSRLSASATPAPDDRARVSATPAAEVWTGPTRIKLTWKNKARDAEIEARRLLAETHRSMSAASAFGENSRGVEEEESGAEDESEPEASFPTEPVDTGARRSGRPVKKLRHMDFDYGSEEADPDYEQRGEGGWQPSNIQVLQLTEQLLAPPKKPGRPFEIGPQIPYAPQSHSTSSLQPTIHELNPDSKVFEIMEHLKSKPGVAIELPGLYRDPAQTQVIPYTATQLMHVYLTAHKLRLYNICDLVTDTWIRAYHTQRHHDQRHHDQRKDPSTGLWRRNRVLEKRLAAYIAAKKRGVVPDEPKEFEHDPPDYGLSVSDPALHPNVLSFDSTLLEELYTHTPPTCGARRFWSDSMALAGEKAARMFDRTSALGYTWIGELKDDVMKTSLRMLRRKVTLKCEESSEGAWCQRYHEHGEGMCYREAASKWIDKHGDGDEDTHMADARERVVNGEVVAGWDSDGDDVMEEAIRMSLEQADEEDGRLATRQGLA